MGVSFVQLCFWYWTNYLHMAKDVVHETRWIKSQNSYEYCCSLDIAIFELMLGDFRDHHTHLQSFAIQNKETDIKLHFYFLSIFQVRRILFALYVWRGSCVVTISTNMPADTQSLTPACWKKATVNQPQWVIVHPHFPVPEPRLEQWWYEIIKEFSETCRPHFLWDVQHVKSLLLPLEKCSYDRQGKLSWQLLRSD